MHEAIIVYQGLLLLVTWHQLSVYKQMTIVK